MMDADWYREMILERFKHPIRKNILEHPDQTLHAVNVSCGDDLTLYVQYENEVIKDAGFQGQGCAISQVSADLLLERVIGKSRDDVRRISDNEQITLLGGTIAPGRMRCALLALTTLRNAL